MKWWVPNAFIGTKDWLLLYEEDWGSEYIPLRKVRWAGLTTAASCAARVCLACQQHLSVCMATPSPLQTSAVVGSLLIVVAYFSARAIGCNKVR